MSDDYKRQRDARNAFDDFLADGYSVNAAAQRTSELFPDLHDFIAAQAEFSSITSKKPVVPADIAQSSPYYNVDLHALGPKYTVLEKVGKGSFGSVYRALDNDLERQVALKVVSGDDRFLQEARTLARCPSVPHIVQVYDVSTHNGHGIISMQWCGGGTLRRLLGEPIHSEQSVGFACQIAKGLIEAHSVGIVHRDLKPDNVLLASDNTLQIADFGQAHHVDDTASATQFQGTYAYMSKHVLTAHVNGVAYHAGTSTDVWSLGAILYEMLTGCKAFAGANATEVLAAIKKGLGWPKGTNIPNDLRCITECCLERHVPKEKRPYNSAQEVLNELKRWQNGECLHANPRPLHEKVGRWCRRQPLVAALSSLVTCLFVLVIPVMGIRERYQRMRVSELLTTSQSQASEIAARNERLSAQMAQLLFSQAVAEHESGRDAQAVTLLDAVYRRSSRCSAIGSTARHLSSVWAEQVGQILPHDQEVLSADLSRNEQVIATGSSDCTAQIWSLNGGLIRRTHRLRHTTAVRAVALTADGTRLLTGTLGGVAHLWNSESGAVQGQPIVHGGPIFAVDISRDATRVLTAGDDNMARLWNIETQSVIGGPLQHEAAIWDVCFSPSGRAIATCGEDGTAKVWNPDTGAMLSIVRHSGPVTSVDFSHDEAMVLTASYDGTARLSDTMSGMQIGAPFKHDGKVVSAIFSDDGRQVISSTYTGEVFWTSIDSGAATSSVRPRWTLRGSVHAASADGQGLLVLHEHEARWCKMPRQSTLLETSSAHASVVVAASETGRPDNSILASSCGDVTRLWCRAVEWKQACSIAHQNPVLSLAIDCDGRSVLTGDTGGCLIRWNVQSGKMMQELPQCSAPVTSVAFLGKERVLAASGELLYSWSLAVPDESTCNVISHGGRITAIAVSPDNQQVASAGTDRVTRVWSATTWQPISPGLPHGGPVSSVAFSPNGKLLATCSRDQSAQVWDTKTFRRIGEPIRTASELQCVVFSPDSTCVAIGDKSGVVQVWSIAPRTLVAQRECSTAIHTMVWSGVTGCVIVGCDDGRLGEWSYAKPLPEDVEESALLVKSLTGYVVDDGTLQSISCESHYALIDRLRTVQERSGR